MKKFFITLIILTTTIGFSNAEYSVFSDFVVMTGVLLQGIKKIISPYSPFSGKTVSVSYYDGIELSSKAKETVDALLTKEGFSISTEQHNPDYLFVISITDARIILQRKNRQINRLVWMKIHIKCLDSSQNVVFASSQEESCYDIIMGDYVKLTDDSAQFSENIHRKFITRNYDRLRFTSFIVITGVLIYFAFN